MTEKVRLKIAALVTVAFLAAAGTTRAILHTQAPLVSAAGSAHIAKHASPTPAVISPVTREREIYD